MAVFLDRLGRFAYRRRWLVAAAWLVVLAAAIVGAATLAQPSSGTFSIPGTPAQKTIDLLDQRFPQAAAGGATARIVFAAPEGEQINQPEHQATIERVVTRLRTAPQVASVTDPFTTGAVNQAGTVAYAQATYTAPTAKITEHSRTTLTGIVEQARASGLRVEIGGSAIHPPMETGIVEVAGLAIAAVVLVITFGSLIAAGLPLLLAILGIGISLALISAATRFVDLADEVPILALMIGLAVAIDYSLFIVSRYRHELALGRDPQQAAGHAVGTAGSAVVFAGMAVVIALAGLSVVGVPFLTQMGVAAAATVVVAVIIALTLLPAMLGFLGRRVLGGRLPGLAARDPEGDTTTPTLGARWVGAIARRPIAVLLAAVAALGVIAIPAMDLRLGMPNDGTAAPDSTQRKAYDLVTTGFGPGVNGPLTVVVDAPTGSAAASANQLAQHVRDLPDVAAVLPAVPNPAGDTAILTVIPAGGPSSAATEDLVRAIRRLDGTIPAAHVGVTGATAVNIDISARLNDAMLPYLAVVVGLAFVLLMLVFRSLLVPLTAALGFLLSVAATFGAEVAVFQKGWLADLFGVSQAGPVLSLLPIFLIGIVFGLAMDYQVFLVTRMREEYVHGTPARDAVRSGFSHSARVVTAAALIMISVFAGFIFSPGTLIKSVGFGLAIAVFFDAIVVRMTLVPAVLTLLGRTAWWLPRWLDRILPNVDVEGQKLLYHNDDTPDAPPPVIAPAEPALR
ncbi:MAG: MMPL family transporter [Dactylosporangium sp.]|nr:MMPL family transporter [Dactylosporangium sp.]NNJ62036.1 MMPL family transporter [Dactylosporangium sp.]